MKQGDVVVCRNARGYLFTEGKEYTVLKFEEESWEREARFTWPAYVTVEDDLGRPATCHAHRFVAKED